MFEQSIQFFKIVVINLLFILNKLYGLLPVKYNRKSANFQVCKLTYAYTSAIAVCFVIVLPCFALYYILFVNFLRFEKISDATVLCGFMVNDTLCTVTFYNSLFHVQDLIEALNSSKVTYQKLSKQSYSCSGKENVHFRRLLFKLGAEVAITGYFAYDQFNSAGFKNGAVLLLRYTPLAIYLMTCTNFYVLMLIVNLLMNILNELLAKESGGFLKLNSSTKIFNLKKEQLELCDKLDVLLNSFMGVESIFAKIVGFYSLQLILAIGYNFYDLVTQLFYVYLTISTVQNNEIQWKWIINGLIYSLATFGELYFLVTVCGSATTESENLASTLHTILIDDVDPRLERSVEIFSFYLAHKKIETNVCGFFTINYSLLTMIVSAATSYLIILVQFQISDKAA